MRFSIRAVLLLVLVCAVALLPMVANEYYTGLAVKIMIYALFALSLQLLVGRTGLVSFGHAAFFGIAAYTVTLLSPESGAGNFFFLVPCVIAVTAAFAAITGILCLRTKGIYFIMVTLAFAQMAYYVFHDTSLGGGTDGIYMYFRPEWRIGDFVLLDLSKPYPFYLFTLGCLLLGWGFLALLMRSRFGAALTGIRINEQRMRAAGYSTLGYKFVAYVIAGVLAGIAGVLFAAKDGYVNPELLAWEQSGAVLLMVILGGIGPLWGAILGAAALTLLEEAFQSQALFGNFSTHWHLMFGLAIIALVAVMPKGLAGLPQQWRIRRNPRVGSAAQTRQ